MIYWKLFYKFILIGCLSFGGGYGMISLVRETVLENGWLTETEFINFIAVSESTPGPLAVNMATFVGSSQGGLAGAFFATLGVVLPAFFIILLIAAVIRNLLKFAGVQAALSGVRPAIVGLSLGTAAVLLLNIVCGVQTVGGGAAFEWKNLVLLLLLFAVSAGYRLWKKKSFSPILLILLSGALGVLFLGV